MPSKVLLTVAVTLATSLSVWPAGPNQDKASRVATASSSSSFPTGEKLTYDVSWSGFIVAGELTLTADRAAVQGVDSFRVTAEARSVGLVSRLVSKVRDTYQSFLDVGSLRPFRVEKRIQHGKKQQQTMWTIDLVRQVAALENGREIALPGDTYDLASIVYALRRVDLTPGKQATNLTVLEDGRLYTLRVAPDGNEKAYTRAGTFDATKLAIRVVENDRAGDSHRLRLYVTRDARRLPVLLTAEPSWGEIRMELTSVEKSVSPADPRLAR